LISIGYGVGSLDGGGKYREAREKHSGKCARGERRAPRFWKDSPSWPPKSLVLGAFAVWVFSAGIGKVWKKVFGGGGRQGEKPELAWEQGSPQRRKGQNRLKKTNKT